MKPGKTKIFIFFLAGISLTFLLYSAIYIYLRNDDWMEHNAKSKFINYSTGYVYDEHTVELKRQYRDYFDFSSIEGFTLPGRLIEKKYWEIKNPKGSHFAQEWKLPDPDRDWNKVLQLGKSKSETAYSELQKISKNNKDLPSGKLAATMLQLWDPLLRTFISSSPREIRDIPSYVIDEAGIYHIKVLVKKDGTAANVSMNLDDKHQKAEEEVMMHTLYCPAKDGADYLEAEWAMNIFACAF